MTHPLRCELCPRLTEPDDILCRVCRSRAPETQIGGRLHGEIAIDPARLVRAAEGIASVAAQLHRKRSAPEAVTFMSLTPHAAAMPIAAWVEVLWLDQAARTFSICGRSPKWIRAQRKFGLRIYTEPTANPRRYVLHSELIAFLKARATNEGDE